MFLDEATETVTEDIEPATAPHPNLELIAGLRDLANMLERFPQDAPTGGLSVFIWPTSPEAMREAVKGWGTVKKQHIGDRFYLCRKFGPVEINWSIEREKICKRVKVGEVVLPATEEQTIVVPAKPEKVVEKFEWQCPESMLAESIEQQEERALAHA